MNDERVLYSRAVSAEKELDQVKKEFAKQSEEYRSLSEVVKFLGSALGYQTETVDLIGYDLVVRHACLKIRHDRLVDQIRMLLKEMGQPELDPTSQEAISKIKEAVSLWCRFSE